MRRNRTHKLFTREFFRIEKIFSRTNLATATWISLNSLVIDTVGVVVVPSSKMYAALVGKEKAMVSKRRCRKNALTSTKSAWSRLKPPTHLISTFVTKVLMILKRQATLPARNCCTFHSDTFSTRQRVECVRGKIQKQNSKVKLQQKKFFINSRCCCWQPTQQFLPNNKIKIRKWLAIKRDLKRDLFSSTHKPLIGNAVTLFR